MAIFYEHIKGCGPKNKYTSWIKWSDEDTIPSDKNKKYLPKVKVDTQDFGTIITSNAIGQYISTPFTFLSSIYLEYEQESSIKIDYGQGKLRLIDANTIDCNAQEYIKFTTKLFNTQAIEAQTINATTSITTPEGNITTLKGTTIEISGKCQASYFNATSDVRAKTNITPAEFSALTVVNSIPTYTFNYINKPQERVLGLIAQEAAQHTLDGFNMVDNLTASGEDGDYMQIKESKLVYVLWKAVQELTDEVESLKAQLNNLK